MVRDTSARVASVSAAIVDTSFYSDCTSPHYAGYGEPHSTMPPLDDEEVTVERSTSYSRIARQMSKGDDMLS